MPKDAAKDRKLRSKEAWERGRGAPKKGNPRYMPKQITDKNGNPRKVYVLRDGKKANTGNLFSDINN